MTEAIDFYMFRQVTNRAPSEVMTPKQVAEVFHVSEVTVRVWAKEGKIPFFRTPGGHRRFRRSDVEAFMADQPAEADEVAL